MKNLLLLSRLLLSLLVFLTLMTLLGGAIAHAQEKTDDKNKDQIENAAKKLFKGLADADMATVFENTYRRYENRKLTKEKVRLAATGPKVNVEWDGNVTIVRSDDKTAVVEANFFKPESSDIPPTEINRMRVFLINDHGAWVASVPKKKQLGTDANAGGWYHAGLFTFCPNKGIQFVPNHFSSETKCTAIATCK
jgi:hypothetical protein